MAPSIWVSEKRQQRKSVGALLLNSRMLCGIDRRTKALARRAPERCIEMKEEITVVSWDESDIPEGGAPIGWWGGFFEEGMRWKDYLAAYNEKIHPYLEAARKSAVKNRIKVSGEQHQYDGITPVFSDGRYFEMTYRSWGDFMAAVWSEEENKDRNYMDFYVGNVREWDE